MGRPSQTWDELGRPWPTWDDRRLGYNSGIDTNATPEAFDVGKLMTKLRVCDGSGHNIGVSGLENRALIVCVPLTDSQKYLPISGTLLQSVNHAQGALFRSRVQQRRSWQ